MKPALVMVLCVGGCSGHEDRYRGAFAWGHEVRAFKPCGSAKSYWVVGDEDLLQPLRERAEKLREQGKPYQPIYVEVVGAIDTQSKRDGFARPHDGILRLLEVTQVSNIVPEGCGR